MHPPVGSFSLTSIMLKMSPTSLKPRPGSLRINAYSMAVTSTVCTSHGALLSRVSRPRWTSPETVDLSLKRYVQPVLTRRVYSLSAQTTRFVRCITSAICPLLVRERSKEGLGNMRGPNRLSEHQSMQAVDTSPLS